MEGGGGNRWSNVQGDPGEVSSVEWRSQLHSDARQRIVNKIMDTLKRHLPINGAEGISELNKIAVRFEEKIYAAATSQSDYLRKISMKMLTMEQKTQSGGTANPIASGSSILNQGIADSASLMQPQVRNQGLPMQVPVANQPQARQQLLGPNLQNNVTSTTVQGTGSLSPALSSLTGLTQPNITTFGQNQNIQAQSSQQQHAPQLQPQTHLQQPMGMQQMHQRLQASVALLQPQNAVELQKQQFQSQRVLPEAPSTSVDSTAQTGQAGIDWQEEVYQKIKSLKEMYSADLQDMSQRIGLKLQQESLALPLKQSEQFEGMKKLKSVIERMLQLLHFPKSSIQPGLKDKLPVFEKQIIHILATRGRRS